MSNAPSASYRQHREDIEPPRVDARVFRQGWLVRTRLDALRADGSLTLDQWHAAVEYRDCCVRLSGGPAGPRGERTSGGADVHARQIDLVDISRRVRAVDQRLGPDLVRLLRAVVVLDRSWRELGRWLRCDRDTARRAAVAALRALGAVWRGETVRRSVRRRVRAS